MTTLDDVRERAPADAAGLGRALTPGGLARNLASTFAGRLVSALLSFVGFVVLARHWGPSVYGWLDFQLVCANSMVAAGAPGVRAHALRAVASGALPPRRAPFVAWGPRAAAAVLAAIAVLGLWPFPDQAAAAIRNAAVVAGFTLIVSEAYGGTLSGLHRMDLEALSDVSGKTAWLAAVGLAVVAGASPHTFAWAFPAGMMLALVVRVAFQRTASRTEPWRPAPTPLPPEPLWPYAAFAVLVFLYSRVEVFLIAATRPSADLGVYQAGMRIFLFAALAGESLSLALLPRIAAISAGGDPQAVRRLASDACAVAALLGFVVAAALAVTAPWCIRLILGDAFLRSSAVVLVVALAVPLRFGSLVLGSVLSGIGAQKERLLGPIVATVAACTAVPLLGAHWGLVGIAAARLSTEAALLTVYGVQASRRLGPGWARSLVPGIAGSAICLLAALSASLAGASAWIRFTPILLCPLFWIGPAWRSGRALIRQDRTPAAEVPAGPGFP